MHKEAYVLSWKKKNRIDGRCQATWGDSETECQNRIFPSCDMVACSFFALSLFRENEGLYVTCPAVQMSYGSLGKKVSLNMTKIPCQKNILHPSEWGTTGVSWLTSCIKKDGLMMHKAFFLTLSILSLAGRCCSHGHWPLSWELLRQLWFTGTAKRSLMGESALIGINALYADFHVN